MHTPDSLMTTATNLKQRGILGQHELMILAIVMGRWLGDAPVSITELDRYLPFTERTRRRIFARLRDHGFISTMVTPNRNTLVLPTCAKQAIVPQPALPVVAAPVVTPPQPPVHEAKPQPQPEPATEREPYVPIKPPDYWHDILAPDRTHAVKHSAVSAVSKMLRNYKPSDIKPDILTKVEQAKYPMAYLASLTSSDGQLKKHVLVDHQPSQPQLPKPQPAQQKATTAPSVKAPKPEPALSEAQPEEKEKPLCPSKLREIQEWLAAEPTTPAPIYRRL